MEPLPPGDEETPPDAAPATVEEPDLAHATTAEQYLRAATPDEIRAATTIQEAVRRRRWHDDVLAGDVQHIAHGVQHLADDVAHGVQQFAQECSSSAADDVARVSCILEDMAKEFSKASERDTFDPPRVAILASEASGRRLKDSIPPGYVASEATVDYLGRPMYFCILQTPQEFQLIRNSRTSSSGKSDTRALSAAEQVMHLHSVVNLADPAWGDDVPVMWPVHDSSVSMAVLAHAVSWGQAERHMTNCTGRLLRLLRLFVVRVPPEQDKEGDLLRIVAERFGASYAFSVSWDYVYAQMLWALTLPSVALVICEQAGADETALRHAGQVIVLVWGAGCAVYSQWRFVKCFETTEVVVRGDSRITFSPPSGKTLAQRWMVFLFAALPSLILFSVVIWATFMAVTNLIIYIVYYWGDCLNPNMSEDTCNPPEFEGCCRDAEKKHGIFGWAAEVGCDILLVVLVEIFIPLSELLANWIADLRDHRYTNDRDCFISIIALALASFESMLFRVCLALFFAPDWVPPTESHECEEVGIWCDTQTELDASRRRWVFEKLLKGPFCVAPFISILMKVIVPALTDFIISVCHSYNGGGLRGAALVPVSGLFRILALILTYDGGRVGCLKFVGLGWPFANLHMAPLADDKESVDGKAAGVQGGESGARPGGERGQADDLPTDGDGGPDPPRDISDPGDGDDDPGDGDDRGSTGPPRSRRDVGEGGNIAPADAEGDQMVDVGTTANDEHRKRDPSPQGLQGTHHEPTSTPNKGARCSEKEVEHALHEFVRKPYEPESELLEIKLNFLGVIFFAPFMPFGVLLTLGAKCLEARSDVAKMLHCSRLVVPKDSEAMRRSQGAFMFAAVYAAAGFHVGVNLITYNDDFWRWGDWRLVAVGGVVLWLLSKTALLAIHNEMHRETRALMREGLTPPSR